MIKRELEKFISNDLKPQKVVLLYGARRVGKTVLLEQIISKHRGKYAFLNGEDYSTELMLSERTLANYRILFSNIDLLIIDEAQNIKDIGWILKLIVDEIKGIKILVSGSSSFDLQNKIGEPLVGRAFVYKLYPFSQNELLNNFTIVDLVKNIEEQLIIGSYPELYSIKEFNKKQQYLMEITNSYLLKDILMIDGIKNSSKMRDLLRLISFQVGNEVSLEELGRQLSLSRNTVEKYLELLAQTFVIFKLSAFASNPRNEVRKSNKWYFFDNGIRNAIIGDFRPLSVRKDVGALWENFLISERIKFRNNRREFANFYFWRTYSGKEVDLIEERNGKLNAFEFKWGKANAKHLDFFKKQYPDVDVRLINRNNYLDFLT